MRRQKKVIKKFKRLLPVIIAKHLIIKFKLQKSDEILEITSFQGLGHFLRSIVLLEILRLKTFFSTLFTVASIQVVLNDKKKQVLKVQLSDGAL